MRLSVIVPVYNEGKTVFGVVDKLLGMPCVSEVIIVDDGSRDPIGHIIDWTQVFSCLDSKGWEKIKIVRHLENLGKGMAVRSGMKVCTGDWMIVQDADLELDPHDIAKLVKEANEGNVVFGKRTNMRWGASVITWIAGVLYGRKIGDVTCAYKLMPMQLFKDIGVNSKGFGLEAELAAKILRSGIPIKEMPVSYSRRREGKKLGWWDAFGILLVLFRNCRFITRSEDVGAPKV
ncbi:MAG: glycosyltransferase family 2 protein [Candidatus Zixiibacteriota bacterium]